MPRTSFRSVINPAWPNGERRDAALDLTEGDVHDAVASLTTSPAVLKETGGSGPRCGRPRRAEEVVSIDPAFGWLKRDGNTSEAYGGKGPDSKERFMAVR
jgi:hypothetical protein